MVYICFLRGIKICVVVNHKTDITFCYLLFSNHCYIKSSLSLSPPSVSLNLLLQPSGQDDERN